MSAHLFNLCQRLSYPPEFSATEDSNWLREDACHLNCQGSGIPRPGVELPSLTQSSPRLTKGPALKLERANREDIDWLCAQLLSEFGYVFRFIFGSGDNEKLSSLLKQMLSCAGGLGSFGLLHFYILLVCESETISKRIGFAKLDTAHGRIPYQLVEGLMLPIIVGRLFGLSRLPATVHRSSQIKSSQPDTGARGATLTYFAIASEFRKRGYGARGLKMVLAAVLGRHRDKYSHVNLLVRARSVAALRLFKSAGFVEETSTGDQSHDPFADDPTIGPPIHMICHC
jgi:ribosomal protein S18 acetylase RimI-like enzyme